MPLIQTISVFLFALILCVQNVNAEIKQITNIREINHVLYSLDQKDLVLFDIDRTLIVMGDQVLLSGKSGLKKRIKKIPGYSGINDEQMDHLLSIVLLKTSHHLTEFDFLTVVKNLQNRKIPAIAFTGSSTGQYGKITNMEDWRFESLKEAGLTFDKAFENVHEINFAPHLPFDYPIYKKGILLTGSQPKGEVLKQFLTAIDWRPKKVIFIDDLLPQGLLIKIS